MIERKVEYLVSPTQEGIGLDNIRALFSDLESDKASVTITTINANVYHVSVNIACEKERVGFVMKAIKTFDKKYNEETDSKVTMKQLENAALDDSNRKKKKDWAIPKDAFKNKSHYGVYKL